VLLLAGAELPAAFLPNTYPDAFAKEDGGCPALSLAAAPAAFPVLPTNAKPDALANDDGWLLAFPPVMSASVLVPPTLPLLCPSSVFACAFADALAKEDWGRCGCVLSEGPAATLAEDGSADANPDAFAKEDNGFFAFLSGLLVSPSTTATRLVPSCPNTNPEALASEDGGLVTAVVAVGLAVVAPFLLTPNTNPGAADCGGCAAAVDVASADFAAVLPKAAPGAFPSDDWTRCFGAVAHEGTKVAAAAFNDDDVDDCGFDIDGDVISTVGGNASSSASIAWAAAWAALANDDNCCCFLSPSDS